MFVMLPSMKTAKPPRKQLAYKTNKSKSPVQVPKAGLSSAIKVFIASRVEKDASELKCFSMNLVQIVVTPKKDISAV
jgi:hypothetical protein